MSNISSSSSVIFSLILSKSSFVKTRWHVLQLRVPSQAPENTKLNGANLQELQHLNYELNNNNN